MKYIYGIKCKINNRIYIGQTNNYNRRRYEHLYDLRNNKGDNKYLQQDFNDYKEDNFTIFLIEQIIDDETVLERETYWINYYGGIDSAKTYNAVDLYHQNSLYKQNLSKAVSGKRNGMYGKQHTQKCKDIISVKVSQSLKGHQVSLETRYKLSKYRKGARKYNEDFVKQLQLEYTQCNSYRIMYDKYPDINNTTLYRLIRFGTPMYPQYYK